MSRTGHSMCVYKGHILIFGGIHEITKEMNDCFIFDLQKHLWRRLFATVDPIEATQDQDAKRSKGRRDDSPELGASGLKSGGLSKSKTIKNQQEIKKPKPIKSPKA